jgi:16S rRNA processing protein RimM
VTAPSEHLQVGYVSRAHGLTGELAVRTFDPASSSLLEVKRLLLRPRQGEDRVLVVRSVRTTPKEFLLILEGVKRREDSEALVGATVFAFRADLPPPEEGEYFQGDLIGLAGQTEDGEALGTVEEIWNTGEVPTIVVRGGPRGEVAVPFVEAFVPRVDLEAGLVIIRPLEYLE